MWEPQRPTTLWTPRPVTGLALLFFSFFIWYRAMKSGRCERKVLLPIDSPEICLRGPRKPTKSVRALLLYSGFELITSLSIWIGRVLVDMRRMSERMWAGLCQCLQSRYNMYTGTSEQITSDYIKTSNHICHHLYITKLPANIPLSLYQDPRSHLSPFVYPLSQSVRISVAEQIRCYHHYIKDFT
jgi:hypothetical protein